MDRQAAIGLDPQHSETRDHRAGGADQTPRADAQRAKVIGPESRTVERVGEEYDGRRIGVATGEFQVHVMGHGGGGKLGVKALSQESKSLQSLAAEGALLAEDAVVGKTTHVFTRGHSSDLYKAASQVEASLKTAKTEPAFEPELRRLAVLAAQVRDDLNRLDGASKEEERAIGSELQASARESQKISEELK